jgi:polysaccharide biosynthesis protein PslG
VLAFLFRGRTDTGGVLRRLIPIAGVISLALALAAPAVAQDDFPVPPSPHVAVGIGENRGTFLGDPRFDQLGVRNVRLIVPYDVVRAGGRRLRDTDDWLQAARDRGLDVLVSFGFSGRRGKRWHLPSTTEYRARVREFMLRYPSVHEYSTWNEANHKRVQPTGLHPVRTAALYRTLRKLCLPPDCTPVAIDVLLTGSRRTWRWIKAFKRRAGAGRHIWGVHNYPDANHMRTRETRRFLRTVKGDLWFTETGGIVHFGRTWKTNERRAARAVRQVFRLAELSPRVKRLYLYSWRGTRSNRRWDSGLISPAGRLRPAYRSLLDELTFDRFNPKPPSAEISPAPGAWAPLPGPESQPPP